MKELQEQLTKLRDAMKLLASREDLTDAETEKLNGMLKEAAKLEARIATDEQLAKETEAAKLRAEQEIKAAVEEAVKAERVRYNRLPTSPMMRQFGDVDRYDELDRVDLALLIDVQRAFAGKGVRYINDEPIRVDPAAMKAMSLRIAEMQHDNTEQGRQEVAYVQNAFKAATRIEPNKQAVEAAIKSATDPMYTGGANIGADWVGTAYATDLWRAIRAETMVVGKIPSEVIPDGYSNKTWPLESTDMSWYKVAEATTSDATLKVPAATVAASQIATASKNITVGKLGARGLYTGELDEDSLIRFSNQLRIQLEASGREMLESLVIDGDVETSANKNINDIAGTPAATDYFLTFDGFRKLALVTNTANSLSAAASLNIDDFLDLLKLMGTAGLAGADPSKVNFIVDGNTYYAMAKLPEVKTRDVNSAATVENGFVKSLWNVGVIPSWQMHKKSSTLLVNTAGKVDQDTVDNNVRGAALAVRWDQWKLAYKRRMTMEVTRIANADTWEIVALTRLGLGYRDTEASAILYNIGV